MLSWQAAAGRSREILSNIAGTVSVTVMEGGMPPSAKAILHQALELPSNDRAALVEGLIASLDKPNPALDAMWLKEAEDRLAAYHAGELGAVDAERAFADLGKKV